MTKEEVLKVLRNNPKGVLTKEISKKLEINVAVANHHLNTLLEMGKVRKKMSKIKTFGARAYLWRIRK